MEDIDVADEDDEEESIEEVIECSVQDNMWNTCNQTVLARQTG